ncbi:hypothetical protein LNA02_19560 [Levilactobacillus namurensis]|nr:hypothetical protein LNA02_19560 [Levilactobacillus namurensis]
MPTGVTALAAAGVGFIRQSLTVNVCVMGSDGVMLGVLDLEKWTDHYDPTQETVDPRAT